MRTYVQCISVYMLASYDREDGILLGRNDNLTIGKLKSCVINARLKSSLYIYLILRTRSRYASCIPWTFINIDNIMFNRIYKWKHSSKWFNMNSASYVYNPKQSNSGNQLISPRRQISILERKWIWCRLKNCDDFILTIFCIA